MEERTVTDVTCPLTPQTCPVCGPVVRVRAVVDDFLRAASRREAAEIGESLLDDDVHVVFNDDHGPTSRPRPGGV